MKWSFILSGIAAATLLGLVTYAYLHGADLSVLNPQGPIGLHERSVLSITVLLSSLVVLPVFFILFFFAWKYRADGPSAHERHQPNWDHDSWKGELVWWLVPTIVIAILSVVAWQTAHQLDPFKPLQSEKAPITIQVIALNWKWLFIYPEQGIATVNMVEFPADTPIHFEITADDAPMNQFWIPSLGGQIMAMPGMSNQINLMANRVGTFNGLSSNISGKGFSGMTFLAHSVSDTDFNTWVASVKQKQHPLTSDAYTELARPSTDVPPAEYSWVAEKLYTGAVMKYMTPMAPSASPAAAPAMPPMDDAPQIHTNAHVQ